ncbi:hypothetical protein GOBAR_AA38776 [Gossypium barbadense]|uniref:Uncharacterized protein n=1 Tax=Gossypium barbadense TaxID=3634 RepID=A0A2P5VSX8_GOSBA|nr:hypothetical protein GOBAR_AA38776 [Gossypium barbadense]
MLTINNGFLFFFKIALFLSSLGFIGAQFVESENRLDTPHFITAFNAFILFYVLIFEFFEGVNGDVSGGDGGVGSGRGLVVEKVLRMWGLVLIVLVLGIVVSIDIEAIVTWALENKFGLLMKQD